MLFARKRAHHHQHTSLRSFAKNGCLFAISPCQRVVMYKQWLSGIATEEPFSGSRPLPSAVDTHRHKVITERFMRSKCLLYNLSFSCQCRLAIYGVIQRASFFVTHLLSDSHHLTSTSLVFLTKLFIRFNLISPPPPPLTSRSFPLCHSQQIN